MKLYKLEIEKERIASLPDKEMLFFVQIGVMLNDINTLHKLTFFSSKEYESEVINRAQSAQSFFTLLLLCGKLKEAWIVIQNLYLKGRLGQDFKEYLNEDIAQDLQSIKRYFGAGNNIISKVRNKLAFHYDSKKLKEAIQNLPDNEPFEIYLSETQGNCFYYTSTALVMRAVLDATGIDDSDSKLALEMFFDDVSEISGCMIRFLNYCLRIYPEKLNWGQEFIKEIIEIDDPPFIDEIFVPPFTRKPK